MNLKKHSQLTVGKKSNEQKGRTKTELFFKKKLHLPNLKNNNSKPLYVIEFHEQFKLVPFLDKINSIEKTGSVGIVFISLGNLII